MEVSAETITETAADSTQREPTREHVLFTVQSRLLKYKTH
jgi:hypothetical protein